jgi:hypothetical protein
VRRRLLIALALALCGCGASSPGRPLALPPAAHLPAPTSSHVVVIVMENHELADIVGRPDAPFINSLTRSGALATASYGVAHPSLPNYLALTGGSTFGITSDCTDCSVRAPNLVDQLERAHIGWKAYMEDLPSACSLRSSASGYAKKHDPFLYYRDVAGDSRRCHKVVPYTQLASDLRTGRLPTFSWITPNLCDDMHDCSVSQGDHFLAGIVPSLRRELGPKGFLVLTWDEGTSDQSCCSAGSGGRVATIVLGGGVRAGGRSAIPYDHYSVLKTVEQALGLGLLGKAACPCTAPLDALFTRPPRIAAGH